MDNSFHEQYKAYTTANLLKIMMQPELYEQAAVVEATAILKTREVTQADIEEAENDLLENAPPAPGKSLLSGIFKVSDYSHETWLNIILAIAIAEYIHLVYTDIKLIPFVLSSQYYPYKLVNLGSCLDLFFLPFVYYMFYKRMRWGWITLVGVKLFTIVPSLVFYFNEYWPVEHGLGLITYPLLSILLYIPILTFLWRQDISGIFKVNGKTRRLTVAAIVLATVVLLCIGRYNHANYGAIRSYTENQGDNQAENQAETADKQADTSTAPHPKLLGLIKATRQKEVDTTYMATGFYFLTAEGEGIKMRERESDDIYTIAPLPFASVKNIISVTAQKGQYQKQAYTNLCLTFDDTGKKALANGTGNPLHPKIAVVIANKLLYVAENKTSIKTGTTCVILLGFSQKEIAEMRNAIDKKR